MTAYDSVPVRPDLASEANADQEVWRSIPDHGGYEVSTWGRVRSRDRVVVYKTGVSHPCKGRLLTPEVSKRGGHLRVPLTGKKRFWVHRLVLTAFVGPCPSDMEGCHNNGNPTDNRLGNLRWDTSSANKMDSVAHGTHAEARLTSCMRNHVLEDPNLTRFGTKAGKRRCLACSRAHAFVNDQASRHGKSFPLQEVADFYFARIMETGGLPERSLAARLDAISPVALPCDDDLAGGAA